MRYPKTPDLDIMNGVHIIRSLHLKKENKICKYSGFDTVADIYTNHEGANNKPTWLVFDKQVNIL